jgi:hypothetical protein
MLAVIKPSAGLIVGDAAAQCVSSCSLQETGAAGQD